MVLQWWNFSTDENQANFHNHIFSGNHDPAQPRNALVLLVSMSLDVTQRVSGMLQDAKQEG